MALDSNQNNENNDADNFDLETSFPEPSAVFASFSIPPLTNENVLVVLDTNVLLLPYQTTQDDLAAIGAIYQQLAQQNRLFIAARAAREFAKHRDRKLAEMVRTINQIKSRFPSIDKRLSPLLVGLEGYAEMEAAYDKLLEAKSSYVKSLDPLVRRVRDWQGDDPVSKMYSEIFVPDRVIEANGTNEELAAEWKERSETKRPPGYKDSKKPDSGIGDYLIWKSVLALGEKYKKDLVFVTNDVKSDWFVRSGAEPLYPRLELIDEYRVHSDGKKVRLCSLHQVLRELNADEKVVEEIRSAEVVANTSVSVASSHRRIHSGEIIFDYSTNDGRPLILYGYQKGFAIKFSSASKIEIHLYRDQREAKIARIRSAIAGQRVYFDSLESSSSSYTIAIGEGFAVLNPDGYLLVGRIVDIKNERRGDGRDEVRFLFNISAPDDPGEMP